MNLHSLLRSARTIELNQGLDLTKDVANEELKKQSGKAREPLSMNKVEGCMAVVLYAIPFVQFLVCDDPGYKELQAGKIGIMSKAEVPILAYV